jgi:MFS superfamily sulfate permease-like transporter
LIFVMLCAPLLRMIPTAALAGVLVYTGFRLIDWRGLARFWREDRGDAFIFLTTIAIIVAEDLLLGVVVGLALSAAKLLWRFSRLNVTVLPPHSGKRDARTLVRVGGAATFLRLPVLAARLDEIPRDGPITMDFHRLSYLDDACLELLESWVRDREKSGQHVEIDWDRLRASLDGKLLERQIAAHMTHHKEDIEERRDRDRKEHGRQAEEETFVA